MSIRSVIKNALPVAVTRRLRSIIRPEQRIARRVLGRLQAAYGKQILAGPFKGMRYEGYGYGAEYAPKIVGTYELEIGPEVERRLTDAHDLFVDIGAAEGYYAVGFLLRNPAARAIAFEMGAEARSVLSANAARNQVIDRLEVHGVASAASLETALHGARRPWLLCDCEGAELDILDPSLAPSLVTTTILLEVHGNARVEPASNQNHTQAMAELMRRRFASTHHITTFTYAPRKQTDWPAAFESEGTPAERAAAMNENRWHEQLWLAMHPIASAGAPKESA